MNHAPCVDGGWYSVKDVFFIMYCVAIVRTNLTWNGSRYNYFSPKCGIFQGDPMPPYLFVLCIDKLSHIIFEEVDNARWIPMKVDRNRSNISHLMFAYDLILFGKANHTSMVSVVKTLNFVQFQVKG